MRQTDLFAHAWLCVAVSSKSFPALTAGRAPVVKSNAAYDGRTRPYQQYCSSMQFDCAVIITLPSARPRRCNQTSDKLGSSGCESHLHRHVQSPWSKTRATNNSSAKRSRANLLTDNKPHQQHRQQHPWNSHSLCMIYMTQRAPALFTLNLTAP